ncbi:MAG: Serine/threonine-protein kinase BtrW [Syntrophus sp. PtaU1.Bin208]|nr:MAG: Serine/threonine-protein kinase BtrW [Syntrophus sp. PtaU1.Bin208]
MTLPATITLPGILDSLYDLMAFVTSHAREQGFSVERIRDIELAVEEVLVNIIKYAYGNCDQKGSIEITCQPADGRGFVLEIADSGIPFDITSVPDPDVNADINDRQIGGLGIYFVKQLMDEVRYRREEDRNKLTLVVHKTVSS